MIIATAILSILFFVYGLKIFSIAQIGRDLIVSVNAAIETLFDKSINDQIREKELQKASLKLFGFFFKILLRFALIILLSFLPIGFMDLIGLAKIGEVISFLSRWDVIIIVSIIMIAIYIILLMLKTSATKSVQANYSPADRLVHMIAFSDPKVQLMAADIERKVFGKSYLPMNPEKPIFITSLPRAGTTLMLEALHRFPSLATQIYRDMPFILSPVLWERFSRPFCKRNKLSERAHGDGMQIGYDSPEAFEEIFWRTFWPEKYTKTHIDLWGIDDAKETAHAFFIDHMKKVIMLRRKEHQQGVRYISKNNGNIARLDLIVQMFPDAKILVMVRNPFEHAQSLLKQHQNFLEIHKQEPFVRRYMEDIGHYEFGALHRPIAFPEKERFLSKHNQLSGDYWLAYWITAFRYVLEKRDKIIIVSYEDTCDNSQAALKEICNRLSIPDGGMLEEIASMFKAPSIRKNEQLDFSRELRSSAQEVYDALRAES